MHEVVISICSGIIGGAIGLFGGLFVSKLNDYNISAQKFRIKIIEFKYLIKEAIEKQKDKNTPYKSYPNTNNITLDEILKEHIYTYEKEVILFSHYLNEKAKREIYHIWNNEFYTTEEIEGEVLKTEKIDHSKYYPLNTEQLLNMEQRLDDVCENLLSFAFPVYFIWLRDIKNKIKNVRCII